MGLSKAPKKLTLVSKEEEEEIKKIGGGLPGFGVRMLAVHSQQDDSNKIVAYVFWPNGKRIAVRLLDQLDALTDKFEQASHLRLTLALVPVANNHKMIQLRRCLAAQARAANRHDVAIHHIQIVANLSMRVDGVDQVDLVTEAVELRGKSNWNDIK